MFFEWYFEHLIPEWFLSEDNLKGVNASTLFDKWFQMHEDHSLKKIRMKIQFCSNCSGPPPEGTTQGGDGLKEPTT